MPSTIKTETGEEKTIFTEEEVKVKENELLEAKSELTKLNEELNKLREKDLNFSNLRSQKDDAEKKVEALKKEINDFGPKIEQVKKEIFEGVLKDHYTEALTNLASGDIEFAKRIEYHYNRLSDKTTSKAEIDKKLRDAWALAQDRPVAALGVAYGSGGTAPIRPSAPSGHKFSDEEKEFAKRFAAAGGIKLSDDDLK